MTQTKDRLRIISGDKALSAPFGFTKHVAQYKKQYIQNRKINGKLVLYNTLTNTPTTEEEIRKAVIKAVTGTDSPMKDLKYLNAKRNLQIARNIGNLEDGLSINDIKYHIRRLFSPKLYNEKGEEVGRVYDAKREAKINAFENKVNNEYFRGTSYQKKASKEKAKALLNKNKNEPVIINLPNGGITKVHPNHPKYEDFKAGTLGIKDLTLPDEMTKVGKEEGGTPVGGSDSLNLDKKQGVDFTYTVTPENQVISETQAKINKKEKAPANPPENWYDPIVTKYNKKLGGDLIERAKAIDRAYGTNLNVSAREKLLLNPVTQLELEEW